VDTEQPRAATAWGVRVRFDAGWTGGGTAGALWIGRCGWRQPSVSADAGSQASLPAAILAKPLDEPDAHSGACRIIAHLRPGLGQPWRRMRARCSRRSVLGLGLHPQGARGRRGVVRCGRELDRQRAWAPCAQTGVRGRTTRSTSRRPSGPSIARPPHPSRSLARHSATKADHCARSP
jgi:hypothetical protein